MIDSPIEQRRGLDTVDENIRAHEKSEDATENQLTNDTAGTSLRGGERPADQDLDMDLPTPETSGTGSGPTKESPELLNAQESSSNNLSNDLSNVTDQDISKFANDQEDMGEVLANAFLQLGRVFGSQEVPKPAEGEDRISR